MDKRAKGNPKRTSSFRKDQENDEMMEIMESDLEDYEVAAELGISPSQVARIRRELSSD